MNFQTIKSKFARLLSMSAIFGVLIFSTVLAAYGQTTTFAQFFERNGTQDFQFTNNGTNATFNAVSGGSPIFFIYSNISGLDPSLQGIQSPHLFVTTTTNQAATVTGSSVAQPLDQVTTVQIIRDTPAPVGYGSQTNLLTAVFSTSAGTPGIVGSVGGSSATLQATTPENVVTFTSEFLLFGSTTDRNLAFSFSSVAPTLGLGAGGFLQSFSAAASGTFASNPPPNPFTFSAAPVSVTGRVLTSDGRGVRTAQVVLTEMDGTVHTALTNTFGNFAFNNIEAGQTVIVSVKGKKFRFQTKVVSLDDKVSDLTFYSDF